MTFQLQGGEVPRASERKVVVALLWVVYGERVGSHYIPADELSGFVMRELPQSCHQLFLPALFWNL
jgi:hypothetical protein